MKTYKIGTRGSLLALTQTKLVKERLEQLTELSFEIVTIKTKGDQMTGAPLWKLEGKEFFTKELDDALLSKEVDLVIHSYKDLSHQRPHGMQLAAVTKRDYAHDILLMKGDHRPSAKFAVGTSSPRRITLLEQSFLSSFPFTCIKGKKNSTKIDFKILRGNIHTRIDKLQKGEYDAIILALAGLERLAIHPDSRSTLKKLLQGLKFIVLPPTSFTSAAAQGALAIECRDGDQELQQKLKLLEDQVTKEEVSREREAFRSYGGGCHLAVGIHVRKIGAYFLHIHQGALGFSENESEEKQKIDKIILEAPSSKGFPPPCDNKAFLGLPPQKAFAGERLKNKLLYDEILSKKELPVIGRSAVPAHYFVTSPYVIPAFKKMFQDEEGVSVWTAGAKTLKALTEAGYWVNGSADSLGHQEIEKLGKSQAIQLMLNSNLPWKILTNESAKSELGETIPCYKKEVQAISPTFDEYFRQIKIFFWTSYSQFSAYLKLYPHLLPNSPEDLQIQHCCGLGKTFEEFQRHGIEVLPFIHHHQFAQWLLSSSKN